jgi:glutamate-ammonia-ligase adenylyltransferase
MRRRLREAVGEEDILKHGPGGLLDLDFIAQLGVLECAARHPEVLDSTATGDQLLVLGKTGWLPEREARQLARTHAALARARHLRALSRRVAPEAPDRTLGAQVFERFFR